MSDSAERRARRKFLADAYRTLPSREALQAAADLERVKMQRTQQNAQMALQQGSLAVAILSQVPRDDENNKPIFVEARNMLKEILKRGLQLLEEAEEELEEDDESEETAS